MDAPAREPRLAADTHDLVLALALGALGVARGFEELVSREAPATGTLDPDDPVVLAALGVLSVGRSLRRWLAEAAAAVPQAPPPAAAPVMGLRELLR